MRPRPRWPASSAPSPAMPRTARRCCASSATIAAPRTARPRGYEGLASPPVPLDAANCPDQPLARRPRARAWDARAGARREARLPQRAGHGHRADRHDRPRHGLRHDRHRARFRARQVQEAGRRRLFQDHQPHGAAGAARRSATTRRDRRDRALRRSATARSTSAPGDQPRDARRAKGFDAPRSPRSRPRSPPPSTSSSPSTNGRSAKTFCTEPLGIHAGSSSPSRASTSWPRSASPSRRSTPPTPIAAAR